MGESATTHRFANILSNQVVLGGPEILPEFSSPPGESELAEDLDEHDDGKLRQEVPGGKALEVPADGRVVEAIAVEDEEEDVEAIVRGVVTRRPGQV